MYDTLPFTRIEVLASTLKAEARTTGATIDVDLTYIDEDGQREVRVPVTVFASEIEVIVEFPIVFLVAVTSGFPSSLLCLSPLL